MFRKHSLEVEGNVVSLPIAGIEPSPYQARTVFEEKELATLAKSIKENGLLQPVSVRRLDKQRYQLIAGERRLRACRSLGFTHISALVCEMDDTLSAIFGYLENSQRADLNPFEEARGLRQLLDLWRCTQEEAARRLAMTQPTLCNKLRLLTLSEEQQKICLTYGLTERHARTVLSLSSPEERTRLLQRAGEKEWSVAELERQVKAKLTYKPKRQIKIVLKDVRLFTNTLKRAIAFMHSAGIGVTADRTDTEEYIQYVVKIPMKNMKKVSNS